MKIPVGNRELELTEAEVRELHSRLLSLFGAPASQPAAPVATRRMGQFYPSDYPTPGWPYDTITCAATNQRC